MIAFFTLVFIVTWSAWALWARVTSAWRWPLFYVGVFAPGIVAIALTWREAASAGVRSLLEKLFKWDVAFTWYAFALGYMAAVKLVAASVVRWTTGTWPPFTQMPWMLLFGGAVLSTIAGGQAGEELGWRGYALPRLARRVGLRAAGILLGVVWAAWHLPLFFIRETDVAGQSFPVFVLLVTAVSVAMTWLYANTGGSLLLTMLFHAAVNNTTGIVPSARSAPGGPMSVDASPTAWWTLILLWLAAMVFTFMLPDRIGEDRSTNRVRSAAL